ncbi:MAG: sigma 54-interacting transcriptional regulator [Candidatus Thorarchaeota archaeon]
MEEKININFFSESRDEYYLLVNKLKNSNINGINLNFLSLNNFVINNDITIIKLTNIEIEILQKLSEKSKNTKNLIIFILNENNALIASYLVKMGFFNIFVLPQEILKLTSFIQEIIKKRTELTSIDFSENTETPGNSFNDIIGNSNEIKKIIDYSKKVAENKHLNILILGETGTGKGLLARSIHNFTNEKKSPFIDIVCTAIPENLMESELFGYEKGAFTNALNQKIGLFEAANNGTLFLDEIGDLSINIQTKLLRVIDRKVIRRLGGLTDIPVNSRIISATNRELELMIEAKMFRRDLYHRLNVVSIELPPLRYRTEDIIPLAYHFIDHFNRTFGKEVKEIDNDFKEFTLNYSWPGNIREFKNTIERAILLCDDKKLRLKDFLNFNNVPINLSLYQENSLFFPHLIRIDLNYKETDIHDLSKLYAKKVLTKMRGNKSKTSKILGISRPKLDSLLK